MREYTYEYLFHDLILITFKTVFVYKRLKSCLANAHAQDAFMRMSFTKEQCLSFAIRPSELS
uniref:Uncharacterized protein n=1 Tax=Anguilla anguilla TaxID=7936 RepID=A0A0E9XVW8_ANGAN